MHTNLINAKDAQKLSASYNETKNEKMLNEIMLKIKCATQKGKFIIDYSMPPDCHIPDNIIKQLEELGYKIQCYEFKQLSGTYYEISWYK